MINVMPPQRGYHTVTQMGVWTCMWIIRRLPRAMWKSPFIICTAPKALDSLMKKLCVGPTTEDVFLGITLWAGCKAAAPFTESAGKAPVIEFLGVVILPSKLLSLQGLRAQRLMRMPAADFGSTAGLSSTRGE